MKKPRKRTFNGVTYTYKYVPHTDHTVSEEDGFVLTQNKIIYISKNPERPMAEVLIHEDLHAVFQEAGIIDLDDNFEHVIIEAVLKYILKYYEPK